MQETTDHIVVHHASGRMLTHAASEISVRDFTVVADEPPSRGGDDRAPTPLEYVLIALCACTNSSTGKLAQKIRFAYDDLRTEAEAELDLRGRRGEADVPVHHRRVRLTVRIRTEESDDRIARLADLVGRYCPVDSLVRAAVPDYEARWERM
jgi:uncharacterized OsmC-like protein